MTMFMYTIKRILHSIPTLFIIVTLAFIMIRSVPGGPFDGEKVLNPAIKASLEKKYHLDDTLLNQYYYYLRDLMHGDFGPSFKYKDFTVNQLIYDGLPVSIALGLYAMTIALFFGILFGSIAALKQNSKFDYGFMLFALIGISVPSFVTAPSMILIFAVGLDLLPSGQWQGPFAGSYLIMPVIALSLPMIAYITRIMRASMIEVLNSLFIRTARAKGLPEWRVVVFHALKPALLPVISFAGPATAAIITGSIVIEQIFGLPGVGQHFIKGAINRDYTLVMGIVIVSAVFIIIFNILADLLYAMIDPKVRYT